MLSIKTITTLLISYAPIQNKKVFLKKNTLRERTRKGKVRKGEKNRNKINVSKKKEIMSEKENERVRVQRKKCQK